MWTRSPRTLTETMSQLPRRRYRRGRLDNGLRVLAVQDPGAALSTTAVQYGVGWRSETPGRSGFAHVFEHLMFEGSPSLPRGAYSEKLSSVGGSWTAYTRADFTSYWSQVPVDAIEVSLRAEADRMRGCTADLEALRTQVSVVREEIRVNVQNRPYGSFPFFDVPPVLFESFVNAHDGYGSFDELERTTLEEATAFHAEHYVPSNAVVTVHGPLQNDAALDLVAQHFGDIPAAPAPQPPDRSEPSLAEERRGSVQDPHAPLPALSLGFRLPDPAGDLEDYVACYVVSRLLSSGDQSRLHRRLVDTDRTAHAVGGWFGAVDQPFGTLHPSLDSLVVHHSTGATDAVVAAIDDEIGRIAAGDLTAADLARVARAQRFDHWRAHDSQVIRTLLACTSELLHGRAELLDELPDLVAAVTPARAARAARQWYAAAGRARVELVPGAA